jgi:hypothetical protein
MPTTGFIQMTRFFENVIKNMVSKGTITQEEVDRASLLAGTATL